MVNYYKKTKLGNWIGIDKVALFRNASAALASGNILAIDQLYRDWTPNEPQPLYKNVREGGLNETQRVTIGYQSATNQLPLHEVRTGKWLSMTFGGTTTTSAATQTHTMAEFAATPYYFGINYQMNHASATNVVRCLLGNYIENFHYEWGQTIPLMQSVRFKTARVITGTSSTRATTFDNYGAFKAGQFSTTLLYNSDSVGLTVLGGSLDVDLGWKEEKSGDGYVSAVHCISRKSTLNLFARAYNNLLIASPEEHQDLTGTINYIGKWWRKAATKATDFIQISANDLGMPDHIRGKLIGDEPYFWEGNVTFINTGKSAGILAGRVLDGLSSSHYED